MAQVLGPICCTHVCTYTHPTHTYAFTQAHSCTCTLTCVHIILARVLMHAHIHHSHTSTYACTYSQPSIPHLTNMHNPCKTLIHHTYSYMHIRTVNLQLQTSHFPLCFSHHVTKTHKDLSPVPSNTQESCHHKSRFT